MGDGERLRLLAALGTGRKHLQCAKLTGTQSDRLPGEDVRSIGRAEPKQNTISFLRGAHGLLGERESATIKARNLANVDPSV